jgi:Cu(I)/Ag(I) efflux system membrane fusion protein
MRAIPLIFAVACGAVLGGGAMAWWSHRGSSPMVAAPATPDKPVLYWYDPMVPNQHFDHPGKSPFMDMQLVPKLAGGSDDAGVVRIDARQVQNLGVRTARVSHGTLTPTLRVSGTVGFDERQVSVVQARVAGIVERLNVRVPLTEVHQRQALMTLLAPEWTAAQEDYLSLRRPRSPGLDALRDAARQRLLLLGMDEAQIRAVERSGQAQTRIAITAPRDGVLGELSVREGATVAMGTPLARLNGLDTVWIQAALPEAQSGRVRAGAAVVAEVTAFPGEHFTGTIDAVLPDVDATTRTQAARIVLHNADHRLAPGMFARVAITDAGIAEQILVPSEAVITTGTRSVVIVAEGNGRFRAQEVRLGHQADGRSEILDGLDDDATVVLSGQFLIDSEASLTGALSRLDGGEPAAKIATEASPPESHAAQGVIQRTDGERWTIDAEAIASLGMEAMSMTFVCPSTLPCATFHAGQRVRFDFARNAEGDFELQKVAALDDRTPASHTDTPGAP